MRRKCTHTGGKHSHFTGSSPSFKYSNYMLRCNCVNHWASNTASCVCLPLSENGFLPLTGCIQKRSLMTVHLWGHTAFRLLCKPLKQGGSFECTRGKQTKKRVFSFFSTFIRTVLCPLHLLTDAQKLRTHLGSSLLSLCAADRWNTSDPAKSNISFFTHARNYYNMYRWHRGAVSLRWQLVMLFTTLMSAMSDFCMHHRCWYIHD